MSAIEASPDIDTVEREVRELDLLGYEGFNASIGPGSDRCCAVVVDGKSPELK